MQLLAQTIKDKIPSWNEIALGEGDLYALCDRFGISIVDTSIATAGFYFRILGEDVIAVNSRLSGMQRMAVLFHELGHFLLHVPYSDVRFGFHGIGPSTRQEKEADILALCALIPRTVIPDLDPEMEGVPGDMWAQRLAIFRNHGL